MSTATLRMGECSPVPFRLEFSRILLEKRQRVNFSIKTADFMDSLAVGAVLCERLSGGANSRYQGKVQGNLALGPVLVARNPSTHGPFWPSKAKSEQGINLSYQGN